MRCGRKGVAAKIRSATVTLPAGRAESQPKETFFCNLDGCPIGISKIGGHDQILVPIVMRHWDLPNLTGLSADAERARDRVLAHIARLGRIAARLAERRGAATALAS